MNRRGAICGELQHATIAKHGNAAKQRGSITAKEHKEERLSTHDRTPRTILHGTGRRAFPRARVIALERGGAGVQQAHLVCGARYDTDELSAQ